MRHIFGEHGIFAVGAYHASHEKIAGGDSAERAEIVWYVLAMPLGMIPLALLSDWFAVAIAWHSDFLFLRVLFTLPGVLFTLLALVGVIAWIIFLAYLAGYVIHFVRNRSRSHK